MKRTPIRQQTTVPTEPTPAAGIQPKTVASGIHVITHMNRVNPTTKAGQTPPMRS